MHTGGQKARRNDEQNAGRPGDRRDESRPEWERRLGDAVAGLAALAHACRPALQCLLRRASIRYTARDNECVMGAT